MGSCGHVLTCVAGVCVGGGGVQGGVGTYGRGARGDVKGQVWAGLGCVGMCSHEFQGGQVRAGGARVAEAAEVRKCGQVCFKHVVTGSSATMVAISCPQLATEHDTWPKCHIL